MASFLYRLLRFGQPSRRGTVTCHLRENGPIGYELELFGELPRGPAETLIDSGLTWAWKSETRDWTCLDRISVSALLADLAGDLLLVGIEAELPTTHLTDGIVKGWIRRFCRAEPDPLAVAVSIARGRQIIFVQQHASPAVGSLLQALQIDRNAARRSAYPRLGPASLESIAKGLADG